MVDTDKGDQSKLPKIVSEAYRKAGGSYPIVVLTDPGLQKVYGAYSHAALKGQDYRGIFRDAKNDVREAIKAGTFSKDLAAGEAPAADPDGDGDYEPSVVEVAEVVKIDDSEYQDWKSSKGTKITAKLVSVEDDTIFVFETKEGKTIRATAAQLSDDTVKRARQAAADQ